MNKIQQLDLNADLLRAILWQYESAPNLVAIVENENAAYKSLNDDFWMGWYNDVFNIDTANEFGLTVWAKILDVNLSVSFEPQIKATFGFGAFRKNFENGNFGSRDGGQAGLNLDQARLVIRARYFKLTKQPTLDNINQFLKKYFWEGDNKVYLLDTLDMSFALYTFTFQPGGALDFLLKETDILPRPTGVDVRYRVLSKKAFGFGQYRANFNSGNFGTIGNYG